MEQTLEIILNKTVLSKFIVKLIEIVINNNKFEL